MKLWRLVVHGLACVDFVIRVVIVLVADLALHPRGDAEADFFGVALGVEREEAGEDLVAEVGGPEQAALISVVVLVALVEEDGLRARGEVVPAVRFEHGSVHVGVQLAQALDVLGGFASVVEAIVGFGHALVAGDHQRGAVLVIFNGFAVRA